MNRAGSAGDSVDLLHIQIEFFRRGIFYQTTIRGNPSFRDRPSQPWWRVADRQADTSLDADMLDGVIQGALIYVLELA